MERAFLVLAMVIAVASSVILLLSDSLTLDRAGRCRYRFGFQDDDLLLSDEYRGTWELRQSR